MAVSVKMSSKNQIVVPREAREALGLVPGDRLLVSVRPDRVVELEKQPRDLADRLEGALRGLAESAEGARAVSGSAEAAGAGALWPELLDG